MHVAITGANGFVGGALASRLARHGLPDKREISRLTLLDVAFEPGGPAGASIHRQIGDLTDAGWMHAALGTTPLDVIFHLASVPGGAAEGNYALARQVNLDATTSLLEFCKAQVEAGRQAPVFVFASTIAVFGQMPEPVTDDTPTAPLMTYGAQKLIGEVLVADFSRRGWVDGRSLRLPGVLARPPAPTGQLSAFMSAIIRELAAGRPFVCPTSPTATTWASSLPCVVDNLLHAAQIDIAVDAGRRTFTLPTSRFSMAELVDAIAQVHGEAVRMLVSYQPDARIEALFGRFPHLCTAAADAAGFRSDGSLARLVERAY